MHVSATTSDTRPSPLVGMDLEFLRLSLLLRFAKREREGRLPQYGRLSLVPGGIKGPRFLA